MVETGNLVWVYSPRWCSVMFKIPGILFTGSEWQVVAWISLCARKGVIPIGRNKDTLVYWSGGETYYTDYWVITSCLLVRTVFCTADSHLWGGDAVAVGRASANWEHTKRNCFSKINSLVSASRPPCSFNRQSFQENLGRKSGAAEVSKIARGIEGYPRVSLITYLKRV